MEKPATNHLWRCAKYYMDVCLGNGQSSDTVRAKKYGLKKFCAWCFSQGIRMIDEVDIPLMDDYMEYLNKYRKPQDNEPICDANKYSLLLCVKTFIGRMYNRGLLTSNNLDCIDLSSVGLFDGNFWLNTLNLSVIQEALWLPRFLRPAIRTRLSLRLIWITLRSV